MIKRLISRKIYQLLVVFLSALLVFSTNISAKKVTEGAQLKIISDKRITGELMEVRENSLLILAKESGRYMIADVDFSKIYIIKIKRKSVVGKWILYGVVIGASLGVVVGESQKNGFNGKAYGIMGGLMGIGVGVIGGTVDSFVKYKEIYNKEKSPGDLDRIVIKLNKKARYPNPNFKKKKK